MKVHVFPFSARRGTPAAGFTDQVPMEVRKDRVRRLGDVERELAREYYATRVGELLEVLVERECPDSPGWVRGTERSYVPVELPGSQAEIGQFVTALGAEADLHHLRANR